MEGYFRVYRKIIESQVFAHQTALKIWIWCLAKASYKDRFVSLKVGKGETSVKIKAGQFIFGRFKAEEELSIDGSTIYKWIQKFASADYNMISIESNNQYSVITICNWEDYQGEDDTEVAAIEQLSSSQVTTVEQLCNTNKKVKNSIESKENIFKEEVLNFISLYSEDMLLKFFNYWSEPNKSKTKMRFETEKTWDLTRRLANWASNEKSFKPTTQRGNLKNIPVVPVPAVRNYDEQF